jgi:hypothetical protein
MKLHVHVGVHKTATTYLQGQLAKKKQQLNQAGVGAMALGEFRPFFTRHLMDHPVGEFRIENHLEKFFDGGVPDKIRGLVLSDENLIGLCNGLISYGKAYRGSEARLERLRELLAGHEVTMFMAIRSYDGFTSSAYCEAMRHTQQFVRFDSFRSKFDREALRWPAMIRRFSAALRPVETKLWRFEDFRQQSDAIFDALAFGVDVGEQPEQPKAERPSFSGAAVSALEAIAKRHGQKTAAELVNAVSEGLPKGAGKGEYPAFDPWSADEHRSMAKLYDEDCAAIPAKYWLIPPGAPVASEKRAQPVAVA